MRAEVYVYGLDVFHPTDLRRDEVKKAFNEDKLKPFEYVREIVEDRGITGIRKVEFYDALFSRDEFLLEYMVEFGGGEIAVKIIGSDNPHEMLEWYMMR